jgi:hypothetical protein
MRAGQHGPHGQGSAVDIRRWRRKAGSIRAAHQESRATERRGRAFTALPGATPTSTALCHKASGGEQRPGALEPSTRATNTPSRSVHETHRPPARLLRRPRARSAPPSPSSGRPRGLSLRHPHASTAPRPAAQDPPRRIAVQTNDFFGSGRQWTGGSERLATHASRRPRHARLRLPPNHRLGSGPRRCATPPLTTPLRSATRRLRVLLGLGVHKVHPHVAEVDAQAPQAQQRADPQAKKGALAQAQREARACGAAGRGSRMRPLQHRHAPAELATTPHAQAPPTRPSSTPIPPWPHLARLPGPRRAV